MDELSDNPVSPREPAPPPQAAVTGSAMDLLAGCDAAGFYEIDFRAGTARFSEAWLRLLGLRPGEVEPSYDTWLELLHPEDSAAAPHDAGRRLAVGTRSFRTELRLRHVRGTWVPVQCIGVQEIDADGELRRVAGLVLDATEDLVAGAGAAGAGEEFGEGLGSRPPFSGPAAALATSLAPHGHPPAPAQAPLHAPVPAPVPVASATAGAPTGAVAGTASGGAGPGAGAFEQAALAAVAEGVLVADLLGRVILANAAAVRLLGTDPAGQPLAGAFRLVRRGGGTADDPAALAFGAERPMDLDTAHELEGPGGTRLPVAWTARAVVDATGRPSGLVVVFRNPDELRLTPDELIRANRAESLVALARGIASELADILTRILAGVTLARDAHDPSGLPVADKACREARERLGRLMLLASGNPADVARAPCDPGDLLRDAAAAATAGTSVFVECPAMDPTTVKGEALPLGQVFRNLVQNAVEAMPPAPHRGRVRIAVRVAQVGEGEVPGLAAGEYVVAEVGDNAGGIPAGDLERIWTPFFTTRRHRTGLGLPSALSIVRRHGGHIAVESAAGTGSVFSVYLPSASARGELRGRAAGTARFSTGRILVMDDDEEIGALTGAMLQSLDYRFDLSRRGEDAIALYRRYLNVGRPYDAVILDLTVLGGMGGEETFQALRAIDPDVRAIVSSGHDDDRAAKHSLSIGFCGYLVKPYRAADLGRVLKTVTG